MFSGVRSELKELKSSETGIQAKVDEAQELLQEKDQALEALKAKLAELERYVGLHHTSVWSPSLFALTCVHGYAILSNEELS